MDAADLRARQRPLKERYRADPPAALVTLSASAELSDSEVSCSVQTGHQLVEAGLHPATGGEGALACSGDMLLQALAACAGVTMRAIAAARGLQVSGRLHAEGELDFRGTLGIARDAQVGFSTIRLLADLDTAATPEQVADLLSATERYCVVLQTLTGGVEVSLSRADTPPDGEQPHRDAS
ncbi:MAG TPA: OsmC family protein [Streptosporangiaceae bacterium]|jgi:uncharacterized OsmC-like protein